MADAVFTAAMGRVAELYQRVITGDPSTAALVVVALKATGLEAQGVMQDRTTLASIVGANDEVDAAGYARVVYTAGDLAALAPDTALNRISLTMPSLAFGSIGGGEVWGRIVVCYAPDPGGADSTFLPLTMHDVTVTPTGSAIVIPLAAGGFYRAS